MAKPLVSANPQPQDIQFKHFGVMNAGEQSKSSLFTSITLNAAVLAILVIVGAASRKVIIDNREKDVTFTPVKIAEKPPEPPKPKPPLPKPPPPKIPPPEPPKLVKPLVVPDPPKVPPMPVPVAKPVPVIVNSAPKEVKVAAAPKVVDVKMPTVATSIKNNDTHPTPVALGSMTNPIAVSNRPAVAKIDLGNAGAANMPKTNGGRGPVSPVNIGGNGGPTGGMTGNGVKPVVGIPGGIPHGTGPGPGNGINGNQVAVVKLPPPIQQVQPVNRPSVASTAVRTGPQVIYKPKPVYTAEATAMHLEGVVQVHIRVSATGAVSVVGVTSGLGHGLDQSAVQVCQGMRFKPAVDANGNPVPWEGDVKITFQMA